MEVLHLGLYTLPYNIILKVFVGTKGPMNP